MGSGIWLKLAVILPQSILYESIMKYLVLSAMLMSSLVTANIFDQTNGDTCKCKPNSGGYAPDCICDCPLTCIGVISQGCYGDDFGGGRCCDYCNCTKSEATVV